MGRDLAKNELTFRHTENFQSCNRPVGQDLVNFTPWWSVGIDAVG